MWPFIIYHRRRMPPMSSVVWGAIRAHELYHWKRQRRVGLLPWLGLYLALLVLHGAAYWIRLKPYPVHLHPMEREGYRIQRAIERGEQP